METESWKPCELCGHDEYNVVWLDNVDVGGRTLYRVCLECLAKYEIKEEEP